MKITTKSYYKRTFSSSCQIKKLVGKSFNGNVDIIATIIVLLQLKIYLVMILFELPQKRFLMATTIATNGENEKLNLFET